MNRPLYVGIFFVSLATLMYEILITRLFSVTTFYHFAFMAVSVAMFGLTIGALLVFLYPQYFTKQKLGLNSLLFALSLPLSLLTYLSVPFNFDLPFSLTMLYANLFVYLVISVPFVFSGICVSLCLTKFPEVVNKMYAADLIGAAIGCLVLIDVLEVVNGPTVIMVIAVFACLGAFCFNPLVRRKFISITLVILLGLIVSDSLLLQKGKALFPLVWVKGNLESNVIYEKWNPFSRLVVFGDSKTPDWPFGWGLSPTYTSGKSFNQLFLTIDSKATTVLTKFNGNLQAIKPLKYDVVNLVHYLKPKANVLVVGVGGGRDILSALAFGQSSVVGVEINKDIINIVNQKFGDFTGHLDHYPNVKFINDEARSYITRMNDPVDIIQVSLIDTWATTAAGAYALTENSLYTVDAWKIFLSKLSPDGLISYSRWYGDDKPDEIYRLVALASKALDGIGVKDKRKHILIAKMWFVGTVIVSKSPFSQEQIAIFENVCKRMGYSIIFSPSFSLDNNLNLLAQGGEGVKLSKDLSAPTDDQPFFFNMLRFNQILSPGLSVKSGQTLRTIFIVTLMFAIFCFCFPLIMLRKKFQFSSSILSLLVVFASLGVGFITIEIAQLQRLTIFLGPPIYGFSVVLFSLLLASGIGSLIAEKIKSGYFLLLALIILLLVIGHITAPIIAFYSAATIPIRILIAFLLLFPLGIFMGMPFPYSLKLAAKLQPDLTAWFWGINGAASLLGSVLATMIAIFWGISFAYWVGTFFYCLVVMALVFLSKK